jgi:integrase
MSTTNPTPFEIPVQVRRPWQMNEKGCWSASFSAYGKIVRILQRKPGATFERVHGKPESWSSLQTTDRDEAEERGKAFLRGLVQTQPDFPSPVTHTTLAMGAPPVPNPGGLTLGELWRLYSGSAKFVRNKPHTKEGDRSRIRALFAGLDERQLVAHLDAERLTQYLLDREQGKIVYERPAATAAGGVTTHRAKPVGKRSQQADVRLLTTMINWALDTRGPDGRFLLDAKPIRGFKSPRETSPERPVASHERYEATMRALTELAEEARDEEVRHLWRSLRFALMLVVFTGRRVSAVLKMRWSDVDVSDSKFMEHALRFRRENDKKDKDRHIPYVEQLAAIFAEAKRELGGGGDAPIFGQARDRTKPLSPDGIRKRLLEAERRAGQPKLKRGLWHPYRRKWVSERRHLPVRDVMEAGGWDDYQTFLNCYTITTPATVASVLNSPVRLTKDGTLQDLSQQQPASVGQDNHPPVDGPSVRPVLRLVS